MQAILKNKIRMDMQLIFYAEGFQITSGGSETMRSNGEFIYAQ